MVTKEEIAADGWIRAVRYTLIGTGLCYALGILTAPVMVIRTLNDSRAEDKQIGFAIGMAATIALVCAGAAALNFVGAYGLRNGKMWGWVIGLIVGAIYAPSACFPFGVLILYGLLRERSRGFYLNQSAAQPPGPQGYGGHTGSPPQQ